MALQRLAGMGTNLGTVEMALFDMMEDAKHPNFKVVSKIIQDRGEGAKQLAL